MENKKIQYKNIFIAYLDKKKSFNERDIQAFLLNLMKQYDNQINYLIVGQKR
ncbi:hypothetical protein ['Cynodon dactylon' phytoplasma]|uniref:hypothetical protein n=1 Tax='Cynodon dactylon' phytoplasma TaxID=295320 RepID=UPI00186B50EF|nr:hypothetical protein ['Cynodon dactylon' phytoplasma]